MSVWLPSTQQVPTHPLSASWLWASFLVPRPCVCSIPGLSSCGPSPSPVSALAPFSPWPLLLLKASGLHSPRPFALLQPRTSHVGCGLEEFLRREQTFSARGATASFCLLDKQRFSNEKMFCGGKNLGHSLDSRLSVWNPLLSADRNIGVVPAGLCSFECQPCQALRVRESLFQKRG